MATVEFNFNLWWTMGKACGTSSKASYNPAPNKGPGIYIIHNSNVENTTYVGYADNCSHRWNARTEVFHTLGVPKAYAKNILCAFCCPTVDQGKSMFLEGMNNCEHLLIRAVVNGLLGVTTSTNSQLGSTTFNNSIATLVRVYLPTTNWGWLKGSRQIAVKANY